MLEALRKERGERYQSASDLRHDIERYLRDEPIAARPASTLYQIRKFAQRNRILVGGAVATMLAIVAGAIVATVLALAAIEGERQARSA